MLNDFITIHQLKKPINNQEYFINPTSINVRFSIKMHSNSLDKFTINDPKEKKRNPNHLSEKFPILSDIRKIKWFSLNSKFIGLCYHTLLKAFLDFPLKASIKTSKNTYHYQIQPTNKVILKISFSEYLPLSQFDNLIDGIISPLTPIYFKKPCLTPSTIRPTPSFCISPPSLTL